MHGPLHGVVLGHLDDLLHGEGHLDLLAHALLHGHRDLDELLHHGLHGHGNVLGPHHLVGHGHVPAAVQEPKRV